MRTGQLPAAMLAFGVMALAAAAASPAAATSLEGYWEMQVEDVDGSGNCRVQEDTLVLLAESNGRTQGTLGRYTYPNIEVDGDAVSARFHGTWDGVLGSAAVEAELNAMELSVRLQGRLSEDGARIDAEESIPCANHRGNVLNSVRDYHTTATLRRVDLAIAFVQQVNGEWLEASVIDFDRPFHLEVRASRALPQTSYPVTLAWREAPRDAGQDPTFHDTAMAVRRVGDDATLYRSGPITFARLADDPPGSRVTRRDGVQIIELAPGIKLHAVAGGRFVPAFAVAVRAGRLNYVNIALTIAGALVLLAALGFAVSAAAAMLGFRRRALPQSTAQSGDADAPSEGETESDAQPDFSATAHRDGGRQQVEKLKSGEAPVIRFRLGAGRARSSIDLETTAV